MSPGSESTVPRLMRGFIWFNGTQFSFSIAKPSFGDALAVKMGRQKMQFVPLFERTAEVGEMGRRGSGSGRVALDLREPVLWLKRNPPDQKVGGRRSVPTVEKFYSTFRYKFATEA